MKNISAKNKGIVTGAIMIALSLIFFYKLNLPTNGKNQYVIFLIFIAGILWSLISYNLSGTSEQKLKSYFSEGFKTFIVVTLLMAVFTFIFYKLNPQIMENGILENNKMLLKEGNKTPMEIKENADKLRGIFMPMMVGINIVEYLFLGSLVSLIAGAYLSQQKKV